MKIRVENAYSDGHESTVEYTIPDADVPPYVRFEDAPNKDELWGHDGEEMWDHLQQWTGDGHGKNSDLGWFYKITILEAADPQLVGMVWENSGN